MVWYVRRSEELPIFPTLYLHMHVVLLHCLGRFPSILGWHLKRRGRPGPLYFSLHVLLYVPLPTNLPFMLLPALLHLDPRLSMCLPPALCGADPHHNARDYQNIK